MKNDSLTREQIQRIKRTYPEGTRIELDHMDDIRPVPPGTKGTVVHVDDVGTIHIEWDNGRRLGVIPGEDSFHVIKGQQASPQMGGMKL